MCILLLTRILEWVAISLSRGSSQPRDQMSGEDDIPIAFALGQGWWWEDQAATGSLLNSSPQSQQRRSGEEKRESGSDSLDENPPSRTGDHPRPSGVVWTTSGWPTSLLVPSLRLISGIRLGDRKDTTFPVVMHGCESWTIKKVKCQDAFELWCWRRLMSPLETRPDSPGESRMQC